MFQGLMAPAGMILAIIGVVVIFSILGVGITIITEIGKAMGL